MQNYFVRKSLGVLLTGLVLSVFVSGGFAQNMFRKVSDFDGDGKTDFAVIRSENGLFIWYVWQSTAGFKAVHWGMNGDQNAAGDYDGDGKTDFAVYREFVGRNPTMYIFYILQSQTNSFTYKAFVNTLLISNRPLHQDYDGDGKTDPAYWIGEFFAFSQINIHYSSTNSTETTGAPSSDVVIRIGDMDGDGRADKAHYRFDNNVVTITNSSTNTTRTVQFGLSNDQYVPADFDGDGIGDLTVWRRSDGTWWWIRSSDNVVNAATWGQDGDVPVSGDYDGDGKTDLAIYRRGSPQSYYWVNGSLNGINVFPWGLSTDFPVSY